MPDLSKTIDTFNGEKGTRSAKLWLQQVENTAVLHEWPDAFIFQTAQSHLEGAAKFWFTGRSDSITDWKSFKDAFIKTFIFEKSKTDLWKRMTERVQHPRENIALYFHEKVALCRELDLSFKETKEQVIIGLFSRDLSNFLLSKEHYDEDQLFQDIIEYDRVSSSRRGRIQEKRDAGRNVEKNIKREPRAEPSTSNQVARTNRCFNCYQPGHCLTDCPKPRRLKGSCFNCGSPDHHRRSCPELQQPSTASTEKKEGSTSRSTSTLLVEGAKPTAPYMVPLTLSLKNDCNTEISLSACLDTGSPISLIKCSLLPTDSFKTDLDNPRFRGRTVSVS